MSVDSHSSSSEQTASSSRRTGSGRLLWTAVAGGLLLLVLLLLVWRQKIGSYDRQTADLDTVVDVSGEYGRSSDVVEIAGSLEFVDRNPGYVGIESCRECHPSRVAEFSQTNHFRTCRVPVPDELPSAFASSDTGYVPRFPGTRFQMEQVGEQFFQTTVRRTAGDEQRISTRIDLVLGAGKTDDIYLAWHDDGRMYELPIAWLWGYQTWGASHFLHAHGSGDYSRVMTVRCVECHNTWVQYEPGTVNQYRRETALLGVTCERCHGPGQDHVSWHRDHPEDDLARLISRPAEMERERQIELCTQCHSNAVTHRRAPFTYRPGEPLEDFFRTQQIPCPEDDHVANQIVHLRQSSCFQASPSMTCITCHDPHHSRPADQSVSASCHQCHQPHDCGEQSSLPHGLGSRCVECHMASRIKINVKFEMADDNFVPATSRSRHRISVDPVARDEVWLKWYLESVPPAAELPTEAVRLREKLVKYWLEQAQVHRQEHRFLAAIADLREAIAVQDTQTLRDQLQELVEIQTNLYGQWALALTMIAENRLPEAVSILQRLLQTRPQDPEFHSKLGIIYAMTGQKERAAHHLQTAAALDPNSAAGYGALGKLAWNDGRYQEARELWQQAGAIEPFNAQIQLDLGLVMLRLGSRDESLRHLRQAQLIDPTRSDIRRALQQLEYQAPASPPVSGSSDAVGRSLDGRTSGG